MENLNRNIDWILSYKYVGFFIWCNALLSEAKLIIKIIEISELSAFGDSSGPQRVYESEGEGELGLQRGGGEGGLLKTVEDEGSRRRNKLDWYTFFKERPPAIANSTI